MWIRPLSFKGLCFSSSEVSLPGVPSHITRDTQCGSLLAATLSCLGLCLSCPWLFLTVYTVPDRLQEGWLVPHMVAWLPGCCAQLGWLRVFTGLWIGHYGGKPT